MSRRRYLSTDAGRDKALYRVAAESLFAHSLYLLSIPSAGDDCALPSNDPDELLWEIWPSVARDYDAGQVEAAIELLIHVGLWEYGPDGRLRFPPAKFYKHQTYIREDRRGSARTPQATAEAPRETAQHSPYIEGNAQSSAEQRKSAQNGASFSFSSSVPSSYSSSPPTAATQPPGGVAPDADAPDAPQAMDGTAALVVYEPAPTDDAPDGNRDLIWDALEAIFGEVITPSERSARNASVQQFRKGAQRGGISERDMARRIARAHEHWANVMGAATETPHGLAKHFGALLRGPQVNGRSNGTVQQHTQKVTEYAAINRGAKKGSAALENDGYLLSHATASE